jgi:hypothetical protein
MLMDMIVLDPLLFSGSKGGGGDGDRDVRVAWLVSYMTVCRSKVDMGLTAAGAVDVVAGIAHVCSTSSLLASAHPGRPWIRSLAGVWWKVDEACFCEGWHACFHNGEWGVACGSLNVTCPILRYVTVARNVAVAHAQYVTVALLNM